MLRLRVGYPLRPGATSYVQGVHYNYTAGVHTLLVSTNNPSPSDIENFQTGSPIFAVTQEKEALFIYFRFGNSSWRWAHYNWWINPPVMRPDPVNDLHGLCGGICVNACLVNASNGLIEALRAVRLSSDFSISLLRRVTIQSREAFDPWHYLETVEKNRAMHGESGPAIEQSICMCVGDCSLPDFLTSGDTHIDSQIIGHC